MAKRERTQGAVGELAGRAVGEGSGLEEQHTHRGSTVLCCYSGSWQVWEGVKRSRRGSCGNHGGREKPLSSVFKLLTAHRVVGLQAPGFSSPLTPLSRLQSRDWSS